ncbi:MAG: family N-acetyltransferase [Marmoricola sp.]|nr:family N-acetyltransferase [Marmoricola sp.]
MSPGPDSGLTWSDLAVADLDVPVLHGVLALRAEVFVVEQACAYLDVDGADLAPGTRHLVGRVGDDLAAYARLLAPDDRHAAPRIGRVVVDPHHRASGTGRALMTEALEACERHWPGQPVELGGQAHLVGFYTSLGFEPVGEEYVEDGIPHVWMRRERSRS